MTALPSDADLKMTIDEAITFAAEWSRGMTLHADSQGWRVVCMLLAYGEHGMEKDDVKVREMAIAVVDALMSNWQGDVGTRLAIKQEVSDGERDLGAFNLAPGVGLYYSSGIEQMRIDERESFIPHLATVLREIGHGPWLDITPTNN